MLNDMIWKKTKSSVRSFLLPVASALIPPVAIKRNHIERDSKE
jgi:hypothetical protein